MPRPQLAPSSGGDLRADGYSRTYLLGGPARATLLQEVTTEISFSRGGRPLVVYRGAYLEYFQLDAAGETQADLHDLCLARDGWDRAAMRRLLHRHGFSAGREESRLRCLKTFRLGLGEVSGARAHSGQAERAFGFLAAGQSPIEAVVRVSSVDGSGEATILPKSPCPFGYRPEGQGRFLAPPAWQAREVFDYSYTTRTGRCDDGGGYAPRERDGRDGSGGLHDQ